MEYTQRPKTKTEREDNWPVHFILSPVDEMIPEDGHWLRKALSVEPNWAGAQPPFHLRMEMYPISKTLSNFWMKNNGQSQKANDSQV